MMLTWNFLPRPTANLLLLATGLCLVLACSKHGGGGGSQSSQATSGQQAGALAVGTAITTQLSSDLVGSGLTDAQATVIVSGATQSMTTAAGSIAVSASNLVAISPLAVVAAPIVQGAIATLNDPNCALTDPAQRAAVAKVIMGSTIGALGGRTADLDQSSVFALQKSMVASAVGSFAAAALTGGSAPAALQAVTGGAVAALSKAGIAPTDVAAAATQIGKGAVESLGGAQITDAAGFSLALKATGAGVVENLALAGATTDSVSGGASAIASGMVASLKSLTLPADQLLSATQGTASGAVGSLAKAGLTTAQIGAAGQAIATAAVGALANVGSSQTELGNLAGAFGAGSVQGLALSGMTTVQIISTKAIAQIVLGTTSGLPGAGVTSATTATAMGEVASQAVGALTTSGFSSTADKKQAVAGIINGTMAGANIVSKGDATLIGSAITNIAKRTVQALPNAGFAAADVASATSVVVVSAMESIATIGIKSASVAVGIAGQIAEGALAGAASLESSGVIDAASMSAAAVSASSGAITALATLQSAGIVTNASDLVQFTGTVAASAMSGLAYGGASSADVASVQSRVIDAVSSTSALASLKISASTQQQISANASTTTTAAVAVAAAVKAGFPGCAATYPDSLSIDAFWAKVTPLAPPVLCMLVGGATNCPANRSDTTRQGKWQPASLANACQLSVQYTKIQTVGTPVIAPAGGTFSGSQTATIAVTPANATVIYTTDGSTPSATNGSVYSGPITMAVATTLKAFAYQSGSTSSGVVSASFTILPLAPTGVTVVAGNLQNQIAWQPVAGAVSYNLYWSLGNAPTSTSSKIAVTATSYLHTNLNAGSTYYYAVSANNAGGESALSNSANATPYQSPTAPTALVAAAGTYQVTLSWNAVGNAVSYNLYRSLTVPATLSSYQIPNVSPGFVDTAVAAGTTYYYVVTAVNGSESPISNQVTASTTGVTLGSFEAAKASGTAAYASPNALWHDLSGAGHDGTIANLSYANWIGSGTAANPYALNLLGATDVDFGVSMVASANSLMFGAWINPSSINTGDRVILGDNGDGIGNGFTLRQSASQPGTLELAVGGATAAYSALVLGMAPGGYWRLGETSGTVAVDSSPNGNNGTYQGGYALNQPGALYGDASTSANFDGGTGMVALGSSPNGLPSGGSNYAITAWIKTSTLGDMGIVGWGNYGSGLQTNGFRTNGGNLYNYWWGNDLNAPFPGAGDGNWHFVVAEFDGTIRSIWADGVFLASDAPSGYNAPNYDITIGRTASGEFFNGSIDEVAIFNYALTTSQINQLYQAGLNGGAGVCHTQSILPNQGWTFIGGIMSSTGLSLDVNGKNECNLAVNALLSTPATALALGATSANTNNWTGAVADLKIIGPAQSLPAGSDSDLKAYFDQTANQYRATPLASVTSTGLILALDAANADSGLRPYATYCNSNTLNWFDLSRFGFTAGLQQFSNCNSGSATGWNGNGATAMTGPTDGPYRLAFDGNQADGLVTVADNGAINPLNGWTLGAWIDPTSGAVNVQPILQKESPGTGGYSLNLDGSGHVQANLIAGASTYSCTGTSVVSAATWSFVAAAYNSAAGTLTCYLNDVAENVGTGLPNSGVTAAVPLKLGALSTDNSTGFLGSIALAAIYDRPLASAEIVQTCQVLQGRFSNHPCH